MLALVAFCCAVPAVLAMPAAAAAFHVDKTPLPASVTGGGTGDHTVSSPSATGTIARTVVGLAIVLAVIYGIYWLLRTTNRSRRTVGDGQIEVLATTPLASNRALHLVRSGDEVILVGSAESGITPLRVYPAGEAATNGLVPPQGDEYAGELSLPPANQPKLLAAIRAMTVRQ
jgi:flagellar protein FliO/FliZ